MIAVTGAAGLLGANLVRELLAQGYRVRAVIHQDERAVAGLGVEVLSADLADPASLGRAFAGVDLVYHLAGLISLDMDSWEAVRRVNVLGTRNVVDACLRGGVKRLVHVGSVHARQPQPFDRPLDENRPLVRESASPYERSKALGELEVQKGLERGLDAIILLPSGILGPYDFRPSYLGQALQRMQRGNLPGLISGGYDWVDARDVADGAIRAASVAPAGSRYILAGHWLSIRDVAWMVAQISGVRRPRLVVPLGLAKLGLPLMEKLAGLNGLQEPLYTRAMLNALDSNRLITHARAARELGYSPRPFRETLIDTLAWFAQHGTR